MDTRKIIAGSPLFEGLPDKELGEIASIAIGKSYQRGETIFFEGDIAVGFYMVAEGRVKIFKMSPAGKEHILHIFGGGEPFGEVPVFHGRPFPASAEALEKTATLYFPRDRFIRLVEANPSIALNMLGVLSLRLRRFTSQIENLSLKEVPARLAGYLLYLSEEQGSAARVDLPITKGQLASLLGTIPETLSRIFAKMSEEGLIDVQGRQIELLDRDGLADL
ncbi:MAG TPA: Crp/Fnr family transcriptional regulator [Desulforhopalus sp.]|nr:Crp/Fnr family transcriptional regulator [Desulforhopalus sp.]